MKKIGVFKLGGRGKTIRLGVVSFDGKKVKFDGFTTAGGRNVKAGLVRGFKVSDVAYSLTDGQKYVDALPRYLHGDYLWAEEVR